MKTYQLKPTSDPNLFRIVDLKGDWRWYFAKKEKAYLRGITTILSEGYAKGPRFEEYLKNGTKDQLEKILRIAGDRGDAVHQLISKFFLEGGKISLKTKILAEDNQTERTPTVEEWQIFLTFATFWERHNPILIAYERSVYNLKFGFAGTFDGIVIIQRDCGIKTCGCAKWIGKTLLFDWKTSSGIRNEYGAQTAAYATCIKGRAKLDGTAILRLGTNHKGTGGYELEIYDKKDTAKHWKEMQAALTIASHDKKEFSEKDVYEIAESVALEVIKVEKPKKQIHDRKSKTDKSTHLK